MFGGQIVNKEVIKMYKGEPHISTTVTFLTPIDRTSDLYENLYMSPSSIASTMKGLSNDVQEIIGETFTADVESVHCSVVDLYSSVKEEGD